MGTGPLRLVSIVCVLFAAGACYRPSDEYLKSKGEMPAPTPPTPEGEEAVRKSAEEAAARGGRSGIIEEGAGAERGERPKPSASDREMGEPEMIDLFARRDLDALPDLDKAVQRTPGQLEPLLRGAFAGVGNDTEKCQEILLYLVIRYPAQAPEIAEIAGRLNPEIQSPLQ